MARHTCPHGNSVRTRYECEICYREDVIDRTERLILAINGYAEILDEIKTETESVGEQVTIADIVDAVPF